MKTRMSLAVVLACAMCAPALAQNTTTVKPSAVKPAGVPAQPAAAQPTGEKPKAPPTEPSPGMDAEAAAWMEAAQPGEQHKLLEKMAGEWDCTVKSSWSGKMEESKATLKAHMRMGGRYLVSIFQGTMMGQPMQGQQIMGYNNITKKYESLWRDNMSTGMMMETGTADSAGKVITTTGECAAPGGKTMKSRTVCTVGDGKFTVETYQPGADGKETKVFEMHCVQTKAPGKGADDDMDEIQAQVKKKMKDATDAVKPK